MNVNDVLALPPIYTTNKVYEFVNNSINPFPELYVGIFNRKTRENIDRQTDIQVRVVKEWYGSHERYLDRKVWLIASIWMEGDAFMIIRNTPSRGDDYPSIFVIDKDIHNKALYYLFNLMETDGDFSNERYMALSGTITSQPSFMNREEISNNDAIFIKAIEHTIKYGLR